MHALTKKASAQSAEVVGGVCLQGRYRDLWQECAQRAFEQIDTDGSGFIEREELVAYLSKRLSPYEVRPSPLPAPRPHKTQLHPIRLPSICHHGYASRSSLCARLVGRSHLLVAALEVQ